MTERLYYFDSDLFEFEAKVVESGPYRDGYYTVLNRSAFYPTSGGQPHDTGILNGVRIQDVIESEAGDVWHLSSHEVAVVGRSVIGLIDKERRLRNGRNHTAQHILSAAAARLFDMETMSVHLGDEYAAVELQAENISDEQLRQLEALAGQVVADNEAVEIIFAEGDQLAALPLRKQPKREGKLRIIRIGQFDFVACGGTHCTTTGGVGLIKVIGTEKIRGRTLVKYLAGKLAVADYGQRFEATDRLARAFTCHPADLVDRVEKLVAENKNLRQALTDTRKELLPFRAESLAAESETSGRFAAAVASVADCDAASAGRLATAVADRIDGLAVLLVERRLILAAPEKSELNAGDFARRLASRCELKGGGNPRLAQLGGADPDQLDTYRAVVLDLLKDA